ncbi:hypothetical protein F5888DRAFT_1860574 [Russula emetica]|nr:hypothetical protein F5888DRAFT_1860574 [Russula emetica]
MGVAAALAGHSASGYLPRSNVPSTNSSQIYIPSVTPYTSFEGRFISATVGAALLSAISVITLFFISYSRSHSHLGDYTHIPVLFGSLLVSNLLQSIGTIIDSRWVYLGMVSPGTLCSLQGGIKQAGNVGTAVWTFMLSLHAFHLLFLRARVWVGSKWLILLLGWFFIASVVAIGPLAIQEKTRGPYFGPSGFWCWITQQYPASQICLEYMLEWTSAFFSFVLYVAVLLRVRGNLIQDTAGKWSLRWVSHSESWQLAFARDYLDSCLVKMVAIIVWYPVIYTVLIVPISIARFANYAGARVPDGFTFLADVIFALGGFANFIHFLNTRRWIPDVDTMPHLSTPRSRLDKDSSSRTFGITPFTPKFSDMDDKPSMMMTTVSDGEVTVS